MSKRFDRDALLAMAHKDVKARYQAMFGEPPRSPNKTWMVNQMEQEHGRRKAAQNAARVEGAPTRARRRGHAAEDPVLGAEDERRAGAQEDEVLSETPEAREPSPPPRLATPEEITEATHSGVHAELRGSGREASPTSSGAQPVQPTSGAVSPHVRGRFRSMTIDELRTRYNEVVGRPTSSVDKHYLIWKIREAEKGRIRVGPVEPGQRREGTLAGADKTLPLTVTAHAVEAMDAAWMRAGFTSRMSFMRTAIREALAQRGEQAAAAHFPEKGGA